MTPALTPAPRARLPARTVGRHPGRSGARAPTARCWPGRSRSPRPARELLEAAGDAADVHVTTADGAVFAARDERHAIVLACGRFALPSLARYDLRMVLADLGDGSEAAA